MYYYDQYTTNYFQSPGTIAVSLITAIVFIVSFWVIFQKANEPGWASIIPFYSTYTLFKITWGNGWLFLLLFIPIVNIVIEIITMVKLSKAFGMGGGFACGLIFLPIIFWPILAFGNYAYVGVGGVSQNRGASGNPYQ